MTALPGYDGPTLDEWRKVWAKQQPWSSPWPDAAGDPSAVQFHAELKERGMGGQASENVRPAVTSGRRAPLTHPLG